MKFRNPFSKKRSDINKTTPDLSHEDKARSFWNWFVQNQNQYLFLNAVDQNEKDRLLIEFIDELHKFNDKLYFNIGENEDESRHELVITAEGNKDVFSDVESLVNVAPKIENWKFIAFRQPQDSGFKMKYRGREFDPSTIIFIPMDFNKPNDSIGIYVCYPDYSEKEKDIFGSATLLMIDTILGEKSAIQDLDYVDVISTPNNISEYDFGHLSDIKEYVEEKKNTRQQRL